MRSPHTVGVLLAAGTGSRFDLSGDRNKLLQTLGNGVMVAEQSARNMLAVWPHVVAAVRAPDVARVLREAGCQVVLCDDAHLGMSRSLCHAVAAIAAQYDDPGAVVVGLADMPFIARQTYDAIARQLDNGADIVQPVFEGRGGHPVGFAARHLDALQSLQGDRGARDLLARFAVVRLAVDDPGVLRDIDVPADLTPQRAN